MDPGFRRDDDGGGRVGSPVDRAPAVWLSAAMSEAWSRFKRDRPALFGLAVIVLLVAAALLAPWLAPYSPNEQFFDGLTLGGPPLAPCPSHLWGLPPPQGMPACAK